MLSMIPFALISFTFMSELAWSGTTMWYCIVPVSSVRRILKRGGGQNFQKIWQEQRSETEIVPPKFSQNIRPKSGEEQKKGLHSNLVQIFAQNQVKSKKKRSSLKFSPNFRPKLGEEQKKKGLHSNLGRFFNQSLEETHRT